MPMRRTRSRPGRAATLGWRLAMLCAMGIGGQPALRPAETALEVKLYPADTPLAPIPEKRDPNDLLVYDGFENSEPAIIVQTYFQNLDPKYVVYAQNRDPKYIYKGKASLRVDIPKGEHNANQVIDYRIPDGSDHLHMRAYFYFQEGFEVAPSCEIKLFGFSASHGKGGKAGEKADGTDYFTTRLAISRENMLEFLTYHPLQIGGYADHISLGIKMEWGRWYCFELELKANTVLKATPELLAQKPEYKQHVRGEYVVLADGASRCWVDGKLRGELLNVRFRDIPELKIGRAGSFPYFGGAGPTNTSPKEQVFYLDEFAVSKSYLGPVNLAPVEQAVAPKQAVVAAPSVGDKPAPKKIESAPLREAAMAALREAKDAWPVSSYLKVMEKSQEVRVMGAAEDGITIRMEGNDLPLRWKDIADAEVARLLAAARPRDGEALVRAAKLAAAIGEDALYEKLSRQLAEVDAVRAAALEKEH